MIEFQKALEVLCDSGVEFVVIGGVSAIIHGSVQFTFDLDVCYSRDGLNLRRLTAALAPFHPRPRGFPPDLPFIWDPATVKNSTVLTLQTDIGDIDLLWEVAGLGTFDDVKKHTVVLDAFGRRISTLSLPALIQAKRAAGREKDLRALPELESLLDAGDATEVK